jgi:uncharacterized coiled-coil DUF342 family protein
MGAAVSNANWLLHNNLQELQDQMDAQLESMEQLAEERREAARERHDLATSTGRTRAASIHSAKEIRATRKALAHSLDDCWNENRDLLQKQGAHAKEMRLVLEGVNARISDLERALDGKVVHTAPKTPRGMFHRKHKEIE